MQFDISFQRLFIFELSNYVSSSLQSRQSFSGKVIAMLDEISEEMNDSSFLLRCWSGFAPRWMTLLLTSFIFVWVVGICAEMNETSFEIIQSCSAAGRDLRRDGWQFFSINLFLWAASVPCPTATVVPLPLSVAI